MMIAGPWTRRSDSGRQASSPVLSRMIGCTLLMVVSIGGVAACDRAAPSMPADAAVTSRAATERDVTAMMSFVHRVLSDRQPTIQMFETDVAVLQQAMLRGMRDERRSAALLLRTLNAHRDALLDHAFVCDGHPPGASSLDLWMTWSAARFDAHIFAWSQYAEACEAHVRWCEDLSRAVGEAFAHEELVEPDAVTLSRMVRLLAPDRVSRVRREAVLARLEVELIEHIRATRASWTVRGNGIVFERDEDLDRFIEIIGRIGRVATDAGPLRRDAVQTEGDASGEPDSVVPHRDQ
ncbi:MAG: hypothetical protein KC983_09455 [Phycisphaerales bacterium]|nr:hypothetical protein [Phycisphaerales bacterium]